MAASPATASARVALSRTSWRYHSAALKSPTHRAPPIFQKSLNPSPNQPATPSAIAPPSHHEALKCPACASMSQPPTFWSHAGSLRLRRSMPPKAATVWLTSACSSSCRPACSERDKPNSSRASAVALRRSETRAHCVEIADASRALSAAACSSLTPREPRLRCCDLKNRSRLSAACSFCRALWSRSQRACARASASSALCFKTSSRRAWAPKIASTSPITTGKSHKQPSTPRITSPSSPAARPCNSRTPVASILLN